MSAAQLVRKACVSIFNTQFALPQKQHLEARVTALIATLLVELTIEYAKRRIENEEHLFQGSIDNAASEPHVVNLPLQWSILSPKSCPSIDIEQVQKERNQKIKNKLLYSFLSASALIYYIAWKVYMVICKPNSPLSFADLFRLELLYQLEESSLLAIKKKLF